MLEKPGMIRVGMDQLLKVLNGQDARCLFGFGKATGKDRALIAVRAALENPLLHEGDLLSSASTVLVHMSGNRSVTLAEVEQVMTEISKQLNPSIEVLFGVSASDEIGDELWVAIISSVSRVNAAGAPLPAVAAAPVAPAPQPVIASPAVSPLVPATAPAPLAGRPATVQASSPVQPQGNVIVPPLASAAFVEPVAPVESDEEPLVQAGPVKPRLKAPLPMPPAPAAIPQKAPLMPRRLIAPEHLDAPPVHPAPGNEPLPIARPASPPPAPTPGVHVDYTSQGPNGTNGPTTITLEPPQPSFLTRESPVTPPPTPNGDSAVRKVVDMNGNGQVPAQPASNGNGHSNGTSNPLSSLLAMRHRGRFENSEPTIIEGQDMDLPTYIRKLRRPE
jgi:hypothetical protein